MNPKYYNLNGTHIAMIGKVGNTAIGKAILLHLKPYYEIKGSEENVAKINNSPGVWQTAPKTETPVNPIIPVRDPVERFRSACAQDGFTDVDSLLDKLEARERIANAFHYRHTSDWLVDGATLYKFPEHIDDIATALGLDEIPQVNDNESNNIPKPDLTPEQLARVQAIYADDINLYEAITTAGQVWVGPEPDPVEEPLPPLHERIKSVFGSLAPEVMAAFLPVASGVEWALNNNQPDAAKALIAGTDVPAELADVKTAILAEFEK